MGCSSRRPNTTTRSRACSRTQLTGSRGRGPTSVRFSAESRWAVLGASPGGFGTVLSQHAWLPVLRTLGTTPWHGGRLLVSRAWSVFDEAGRLASDTTKEQLRQFIEGFV